MQRKREKHTLESWTIYSEHITQSWGQKMRIMQELVREEFSSPLVSPLINHQSLTVSELHAPKEAGPSKHVSYDLQKQSV